MTSGAGASSDTSTKGNKSLPQYGFGSDVTFSKLIEGNPYLFRVHTPRAHPPQYDASEPYFVGPKYSDTLSSAAIKSPIPSSSPKNPAASLTYADVAQHLDWTTRSESPYVSTSFSFAWAVFEAIKRYHVNVKHDVEIAVIDARSVADRAVTAVELLMKGSPRERHKDHWKWYRFAVEAQDVLVWGYIPGSSILASVPLLQIIPKLPSYFLYPDVSDSKDTPLSRLSWDYTHRKPNFRQFCQLMSDRFLKLSMDKRMRDTTVGSVRLAMCLLRPYIHKHISDDFTNATTHVCDLAYVIACWPGQWWVREHPEIHDLLRCIIHIVGEEMREARRVQALADATRMQDIVGGLEQIAKTYESRSMAQKRIPPPPLRFHSRQSSAATLALASPSAESESWSTSSTSTLATMETKGIQTEVVESKNVSNLANVPEEPKEATLVIPPRTEAKTQSAPLSPLDDSVHELQDADAGINFQDIMARTASCFFTGLFIGSFVTLCVWSSHRRELTHYLACT
ncbi:hypothetical protein K474DRAFT_1664356 [Panus rudis PR-1116 ss-1]|nr:hypothetical protein K474DRAFT_1664356 [Panus rudis PR-1116 ss-1]